MGKKPFSLSKIQHRIKSDRELTSEESARESFWTPTVEHETDTNKNKSIISNDIEAEVINLNIDLIDPDPNQPRRYFGYDHLEELKESIKERGVETPIHVRRANNNRFKLISGERRWRCCVELGIEKIPAIIKEMDDANAFFSALIENIQRENLHFLDEAFAYKSMLEKNFVKNQNEIASQIHVNRQRISERLKITTLPEDVQQIIYSDPGISFTHALLLSNVKDPLLCLELAKKVSKERLPKRKLEALIAAGHNVAPRHKSSFKPIQFKKKPAGFDLTIKYRIDRPEDKEIIIKTLEDKLKELKKEIADETS